MRTDPEPARDARSRARPSLRTLARRLLVVLAIVGAPLLVFSPIVFSGYTFSQTQLNPVVEPRSGGATSLTVIDPAASANQDEPWLAFIAENLAHGELTLVDLKNGLGAPFLESLQPGALYVLNPLLLLLDTRGPGFFDAFVIVHVVILLAGLYRLFRSYSRPSIALAMALMVGLSGVTFEHLNMVNYRGFAWLPWMLEPALRIARGRASRASVAQFVLASVASITAGNAQDCLFSLGTVCAGFAIECWAWRKAAVAVRRRVGALALALAAALMLGSPAILPYLVARADVDVVTAVDPERSVTGLHLDWFLPLVLPKLHGIYPGMLRAGPYTHWLSGFTTIGAFLVLAACVSAVWRGKRSDTLGGNGPSGLHDVLAPERRVALLGWLAFLAIALLKIYHVFVFDFLQRVPFLCEVLFTKYHLFVFVPLGIAGSLALEVFTRAERPLRRRILARTCAIGAALGALIALHLWLSPNWSIPADLDALSVRKLTIAHATSLAVLALSLLLLRSLNERVLWLLVPLFVAQATLLRPDGYARRLARYQLTVEASDAARVTELCAAPYSDASWERGVCTRAGAAAFLVQQVGDLRAIHAGSKLRFAAAGVREVERVSACEVWLAGPPLDPVRDGCPRPIEIVSAQDFAPPKLPPDSRILTSLQANQNLIAGVESVCVFNPILNRRFAAQFTSWFPTFYPDCDLQIQSEPGGLSLRQVNALRFLGVRAIYGYEVDNRAGVKRVEDGVYEVEGALPRMFLLTEEDFVAVESSWHKVPLGKSVRDLRDAIGNRALAVTIGTRSIAFQSPGSFRGRLVANQAFSRAWTYDGREGQPFCGMFPSWKVDFEGGAAAREIVYWPRGLTPALWVAGAGALVGLVALFLVLGRRP